MARELAMFYYGWAMWASGNYDKAIEASLKSLNLFRDLKNYDQINRVYEELAVFYRDAGDFGQALKYAKLSRNLYDSLIVSHSLEWRYSICHARIYLYSGQSN